MRRYLEVESGSIPLLLIASAARGEARNSINRSRSRTLLRLCHDGGRKDLDQLNL
jgi:hypothetical protein